MSDTTRNIAIGVFIAVIAGLILIAFNRYFLQEPSSDVKWYRVHYGYLPSVEEGLGTAYAIVKFINEGNATADEVIISSPERVLAIRNIDSPFRQQEIPIKLSNEGGGGSQIRIMHLGPGEQISLLMLTSNIFNGVRVLVDGDPVRESIGQLTLIGRNDRVVPLWVEFIVYAIGVVLVIFLITCMSFSPHRKGDE